MLELGGFQAWITVEGAETQEYNAEVSDDGKTSTCWISSEVGKRFAVHWKDTIRLEPTSGYVKLDGVKCGGKLIRRPNVRDNTSLGDVITSSTTVRPFLFSPLELTDDDSYLDSASSHNIGHIVLEIWRTQPTAALPCIGQVIPPEEKVHERSKKVGAHRVKFGEESYRSTPVLSNVKKLDSSPLVTFSFKYRPLDILRANGIISSHVAEKRKVPFNVDDKADVDGTKPQEERANPDAMRGSSSKKAKREIKPAVVNLT